MERMSRVPRRKSSSGIPRAPGFSVSCHHVGLARGHPATIYRLELVVTEYFKVYNILYTRLGTMSDKADCLHMNKISNKFNMSIEPTRESLLDISLASETVWINRLPPELLIKIFQFNLDIYASRYMYDIDDLLELHIERIISLSYVCSYWRQVAVKTSSFWSHIPIHLSEALVALCVERADNTPLDIVATKSSWGATTLWEGWERDNALRAKAHHIRSLTILAHTRVRVCLPIDWVLEPGIQQNLQELSVHYTGYCRNWPNLGLSTTNSSPCIKLDGLARGLCTLRLKRIGTNWYECAFENLNELKLEMISLDLQELERVLLASPVLQVLELIHLITPFRFQVGPRDKPKPLNLSYLRRVYLRAFDSNYDIWYIVSMFGPGAHRIELYINFAPDGPLGSALWQHSQAYIQMLQHTIHETRNVTVFGIGHHMGRAQALLFPYIVAALPDLTTIRLLDMKLGREPLLVLEDTLRRFPQIKQLEIKSVNVTEAEAFKNVIENSSLERIELVNCRGTQDGEISPIESGTSLYNQGLELAPEVSIS
ncbi:unnamed protein product [Rhizoctonia solani]|uniref:F-box domain-containing protein n=1 Tax=Rhizoctonia solani TaxID=456999 RepID=A0A8H3DT67_9AGAM|nr:unnamed protein product [Rhizoctonia solani]